MMIPSPNEKVRLSPKQRMVLRAFAASPRRWRTVVQACEAEDWSLARQRALDRAAICLADRGLLACMEEPGGQRVFLLTSAGRVAVDAAMSRRKAAAPPTPAVKGRTRR
jgi:hypothetical protein